jgi:hypothetical protein
MAGAFVSCNGVLAGTRAGTQDPSRECFIEINDPAAAGLREEPIP